MRRCHSLKEWTPTETAAPAVTSPADQARAPFVNLRGKGTGSCAVTMVTVPYAFAKTISKPGQQPQALRMRSSLPGQAHAELDSESLHPGFFAQPCHCMIRGPKDPLHAESES